MSAGLIKSALLSVLSFVVLVGAWHLATLPKGERAPAPDEYAKLLGKGAKKSAGFPTPAQIGETIVKNLSEPFYDRGPNDKGVGIQLAHSLARVGLGYLLAMLLSVPLGFVVGMSPRSEEHTSELQSLTNLVCRLLLEKKKGRLQLASGDDPSCR